MAEELRHGARACAAPRQFSYWYAGAGWHRCNRGRHGRRNKRARTARSEAAPSATRYKCRRVRSRESPRESPVQCSRCAICNRRRRPVRPAWGNRGGHGVPRGIGKELLRWRVRPLPPENRRRCVATSGSVALRGVWSATFLFLRARRGQECPRHTIKFCHTVSRLHNGWHGNAHDRESANQFAPHYSNSCQQKSFSLFIRLTQDWMAVVESIEEL